MYSEDAYCLGLLYVYQYSNKKQMMISLNDLKNFHQTVESNLEQMNFHVNQSSWYDNEELIYFISINQEGEVYYILKPNFDFEKSKTKYIGVVPIEYLLASQQPNALNCLGLIKIENKIFTKSNLELERKNDETKKHVLKK